MALCENKVRCYANGDGRLNGMLARIPSPEDDIDRRELHRVTGWK